MYTYWSRSKEFGTKIPKKYPRGYPGIPYKDFQHQMQLNQHNAMFVLLELVLLWHYLNNVLYAFRFSVRSFLKSIWRLKVSSRKQHQQSHQQTHKHKTYIEHSFRAQYWCLHSVVFNLCIIIQNQGIWKTSSFYCLIRLAFSFRTPLSRLPLTCDKHVVSLQRNVSQCVQIWIFNISNRYSFPQLTHLCYK